MCINVRVITTIIIIILNKINCQSASLEGSELTVECNNLQTLFLHNLSTNGTVSSLNILSCKVELNPSDPVTIQNHNVTSISMSQSDITDNLQFWTNYSQLISFSMNHMDGLDGKLLQLPTFPNLVYLNFSKNDLTRVPATVFSQYSLQILDLSHNNLTTFEGNRLSDSIKEVYLQHNNIINPTLSTNLYLLTLLDLSSNKIQSLNFMTDSSFPNKLNEIHLRENIITNFTKQNIDFHSTLSSLDLRYNLISSLPSTLGEVSLDNHTVNFVGNPFICDCNLIWLISSAVWIGQTLPVCAYPAKYRNMGVTEVVLTVCDAVEESRRATAKSFNPSAVLIAGGIVCAVVGIVLTGYIVNERRHHIVSGNDGPQGKDFQQPLPFAISSNQELFHPRSHNPKDHQPIKLLQQVKNKLDQQLMSNNLQPVVLNSSVQVTLTVVMIQIQYDDFDLSCSASCTMIEYPIAPCVTPIPGLHGHYYEGNMEEYPRTAVNTQTISSTDLVAGDLQTALLMKIAMNEGSSLVDWNLDESIEINDRFESIPPLGSKFHLAIEFPKVPHNSMKTIGEKAGIS